MGLSKEWEEEEEAGALEEKRGRMTSGVESRNNKSYFSPVTGLRKVATSTLTAGCGGGQREFSCNPIFYDNHKDKGVKWRLFRGMKTDSPVQRIKCDVGDGG